MSRAAIIATGSYLPARKVTNDDLAKVMDTSDEWISERTGIKQRFIAEDGQTCSDMAAEAARNAISGSSVSKDDIDLIIVATTTPDKTFPSVATMVQAKLDIKKGAAFDVQAVCAGFIYALSVADSLIKSGMAKTALVIGADKMSSIVDWDDRRTCVLFGDGAGAVILQATDDNHRGIMSNNLYADGSCQDILYVDGGVSSTGSVGKLRMQGKEVFKHAVSKMCESVKEELIKNNLSERDIDLFIPHQANLRILESVAKKLSLKSEQVAVTVDRHANTSAATIPLALDDYAKRGLINSDNIVVLTAIGGGLTWGTCILRW